MPAPMVASLREPPIAFAHRGARAHEQENTLAAFRLAQKLGATGLESDVWLTADGEAVLDHDGVVRRGFRKVPIRAVPRTELPPHIPTLADLYAACGTDLEISLDVKDADAIDVVLATARAAGAGAPARLWLCHPSWEVVAGWRSRAGEARLVDSTRLHRIKEGPERRAAALANAGVDAINLHWTDWTAGMVSLVHRFGRYALGWDAQHERMLDQLLGTGVDGIYSDHVDRMMEAVTRRRVP